MGMTSTHLNLYILVIEKNVDKDKEISPFCRDWTRRKMSETQASAEDQYEPGYYEIRIRGHLADRWAD